MPLIGSSFADQLPYVAIIVVALAATILGFLFHKPLSELLRRTDRLKYKDAELQAPRERERLPERAGGEEVEPPPADPQADPARKTESLADTELGSEDESAESPKAVLAGDDPMAVRRVMAQALAEKDADLGAEAMGRLRQVEHDTHERELDEVRYAFLQAVQLNDPEAVDRLREMTGNDAVKAMVLRLLGFIEARAGNPGPAATAYRQAAEAEGDPGVKAQNVIEAAFALRAAGRIDDAEALLKRELLTATGAPAGLLWRSLADLYAQREESELRGIALQRALEHRAGDPSLRFDTAYALGEVKDGSLTPLVVHHYELLKLAEPTHEGAWNNLGVQYESAELPLMAVRNYKQARELGMSLAAANLAYRYLRAGFGDDAESVLNDAITGEEPHQNVGAALARLGSDRDAETTRVQELKRVGQQQADFMSRHADALIRSSPDRFAGTWKFDSGEELTISVADGRLSAEWEYKRVKRELKGTLRGEAAKARYSEMSYSNWGGERHEVSFDEVAEDWLQLDPQGAHIELMRVRGAAVSFLRLART
jgi:Flp pilus assembly protein TadD